MSRVVEEPSALTVALSDCPPRIAATCTVDELFYVEATGIRSGISKIPRDEGIKLLTHGVLGDVQGDTEHHGGLFKAVYAFARETRDEIARREGLSSLGDGAFGENLVTEGIDTDEVVIGTRWRVGGAELEASVPRQPCKSFSTWMKQLYASAGVEPAGAWGRRFNAYGKCGAYFRVVREGVVRPGDEIEVFSVPEHGVSIGEFFRGASNEIDPTSAKALLSWARNTETSVYTSMAKRCLAALESAGISFEFPASLITDGRGH